MPTSGLNKKCKKDNLKKYIELFLLKSSQCVKSLNIERYKQYTSNTSFIVRRQHVLTIEGHHQA